MNTSQIESFFAETREAFQFLKQHYRYQSLEEEIKYPDDARDTIAFRRYGGSRIGVEVWWYPDSAILDVTFVELLQEVRFPSSYTVYPLRDSTIPRAIRLLTLLEMLNVLDEADFFLKDITSSRRYKKRVTAIETHRPAIVDGLGRATQTYASDILKGNTEIFPGVMNYFLVQQKRLYPNLSIPDLKQPDELSQS